MIKKILIAVLVLSIAFVFLCTPVSADEVEVREPYIDLLEYFGFSGALRTWLKLSSSGVFDEYMRWGGTIGSVPLYSIEIVLAYSGTVAPSLDSLEFRFNSDNTGASYSPSTIVAYPMDGIMRIRCNLNGSPVGRMNIRLTAASSDQTLNCLSVRAFLTDASSVLLPGVMNTPAGSSSVAADGGGYSSFDIGSSSGIVTTTIRIGVDDWRNYDIISLSGYLSCTSIVSVNAVLLDNTTLRDIVIPFDHNYFGEYSGQSAIYRYSLRADLTGIDHVTQPDSTLWFYITCNLASSTTGVIYVDSILGSINAYVDFSKLFDNFMVTSLNSIYSYVMQIRSNTSNMQNYILRIRDLLIDYLPQILDAIGVSDEEANEAQNKADSAQSSADSLNGLGQSIHSGTPSIDTNMQITPGVIPSDGSDGLVTNLFDLFWGNSMILSMITTVAAIATISYVFFGKKG